MRFSLEFQLQTDPNKTTRPSDDSQEIKRTNPLADFTIPVDQDN